MEKCLTNIIKLSRTECACFDEGKPVDYNAGQSEVYLDELEGINLTFLGGIADCENGGIWDLMAWARDEAAKQFKADLLSCIGANYVSKRPIYSGLLGQTNFTGTLTLPETKAGVKFVSPQIKGGTIKIKRIGLALNSTLPITVEVYNNDENSVTPIASYVINSVANTLSYAVLGTPLELPLYSNNVNRLEYYFVYDRVGFQPKDNKLDCNCGGKVSGWKNWISLNGIQGNGSSYSTFTTSKYLNGLILDVDLRCVASELICSDDKPLDFDNDGFDMQIAYANRWKAGELLLQKMLDSAELNRYTMMEREKTYGIRNHARKMYNDFIQYLCENKEISTGCLACKPNPNFTMGNIIS